MLLNRLKATWNSDRSETQLHRTLKAFHTVRLVSIADKVQGINHVYEVGVAPVTNLICIKPTNLLELFARHEHITEGGFSPSVFRIIPAEKTNSVRAKLPNNLV